MADLEIEDEFLLRLPPQQAETVRESIQQDTLQERLQVQFYGDMRGASVKLDDLVLQAKLVDLPCIIESCKTLDKKTFYKAGDICQMLVCSEEDKEDQTVSLDSLPLTRHKEALKRHQWNHGITPPLKNVRKRRFRRTAPKKYIDSPELEKEVQRLIKEDLSAIDVSFKLVYEEENKDDTQSLFSDGPFSRQVSPPPNEDDDSLMGADSQLLKIIAEESSESDDSLEITVHDEDTSQSSKNHEIEAQMLREAIRALQSKINSHKSKIEMEPNIIRKRRLEEYLKELKDELVERKEKLAAVEELL